MNRLLKECFNYAENWKVRFNPAKSTSYSLYRPAGASFIVNETVIPSTDIGFIYLGMPIGTHNFVADHFNCKFAKVERSFYSLRGIGCCVAMLPPKSLAYIYKQFCQSICRYGMECLYIDDKTLGVLNVRQNVLLKHALGLNSRCRTKPLLHCLNVDQIGQIYQKHKLFGIKQFLSNDLSASVFNWLSYNYSYYVKPNKRSFFYQLDKLGASFDGFNFNSISQARSLIDSEFMCNDIELVTLVADLLNGYNSHNWFLSCNRLKSILSVI